MVLLDKSKNIIMTTVLTIEFKEEPKGLDELLNGVKAIQKLNSFTWKWNDPIGDMWIKVFEKPYILKISVDLYPIASMTEKKINRLATEIDKHYSDCKIQFDYEHSW